MVQQAARKPIRAGARGGDIYVEADKVFKTSPHANIMHFCAHGMGMIPHEAPRLTGSGPVPYPGYDEDLPLEEGMVISIETTHAASQARLCEARGYGRRDRDGL